MLLSRLAEKLFWLGRYLERTEDISRAIVAYEQLRMDMPAALTPGFRPLAALFGEQLTRALSDEPEQEQLLRLLVLDPNFDSSVVNCLTRVRENVRVTRPLLPKEAWNSINVAHLSLLESEREHTVGQMLAALEHTKANCQQLSAQLSGTMNRDSAFAFLKAGRFLERADMLLRVTRVAQDLEALDSSAPFDDVRWMGLLNALGAHQMYRRTHHGRTDAHRTLTFLLTDQRFPRSFAYCIHELRDALRPLPNSPDLVRRCTELGRVDLPKDARQPRAYADHMLRGVERLASSVEQTYFH